MKAFRNQPRLEEAVRRYRQGQCPLCGSGKGERRGLEQRKRKNDIYCHTCRRSWPLYLSAEVLREELLPVEVQGIAEKKGFAEPPSPSSRIARIFSRLVLRR